MPFTDAQIKALSAKLSAKHVKTREHLGMTLSYIEGWHAIAEANRIFGFDAWDRETMAARCVWDAVRQGRHHCSYTAQVRVRVRMGDSVVCREANGAGHGSGMTPGEAHESALKEAETDAMKRALVTFGNPFGLALYDKEQRGVRRSGAKPKHDGGRQVLWTVFSETGEPIGNHQDPVSYCTALRKQIEAAKPAEKTTALWERNQGAVAELRRVAPDLTTNGGEHYADVLGELYRKHVEGLAARTAHAFRRPQMKLDVPARVRDKEHLRYVAAQPCLVCGRTPSQAHHIRFAQPRALGRKVSDAWTVPLCTTHHRALHNVGDEKSWWTEHKADPTKEAQRLWRVTSTGATTAA